MPLCLEARERGAPTFLTGRGNPGAQALADVGKADAVGREHRPPQQAGKPQP